MITMRGTAADLIDKVRQKSPAYLDLATAETDEEFEAAFERILELAVQHLESNSKNFAPLNEEGLTGVLGGTLSIPDLLVAYQEANSNGHADLVIDTYGLVPQRRKLVEAKIYKDFPYHMKGLEQLLKRYTTGREGRSLLIVYVKKPGISEKMQRIRECMDQDLPLKQKGAATDHRLKWSFATVHEHDCGDDCAVDHIGCNLDHT